MELFNEPELEAFIDRAYAVAAFRNLRCCADALRFY